MGEVVPLVPVDSGPTGPNAVSSGWGAHLSCSASNTATESQIGTTGLHDAPLGVSIDWLTVVQEHPASPIKGSCLLLFVDPDTGEVQSQAVRSYQHQGSHDSKLMVRCDGRRVEVSGNPSKWCRPHSLDGLTSVQGCVDLYNLILRTLGLPEFFEDQRDFVSDGQRSARGAGLPVYESEPGIDYGTLKGISAGSKSRVYEGGSVGGMRITRLDLCQAFQTGSVDDAAGSIRALGQVVVNGKVPMVYGNGETVAWYSGSRFVYVKYYSKGVELSKHGGPDCAEVAAWATSVGLVRHEVTLKSMFLSKEGLSHPSAWTEALMTDVIKRYAMHERMSAASTSYDRIYERLMADGLSGSRARRAQEAAYAYLGGHVFRVGHNIPKTSFYRLRADLLRVGLDIAAPLNVSALRYSVKVVEWRPATLPKAFRRSA